MGIHTDCAENVGWWATQLCEPYTWSFNHFMGIVWGTVGAMSIQSNAIVFAYQHGNNYETSWYFERCIFMVKPTCTWKCCSHLAMLVGSTYLSDLGIALSVLFFFQNLEDMWHEICFVWGYITDFCTQPYTCIVNLQPLPQYVSVCPLWPTGSPW